MTAGIENVSLQQQRANVIRQIYELCRLAMADPARFDNDPLTMTVEIYVAVTLRGREALLPAEAQAAIREVLGDIVGVSDGTD